MCPSPALRSRWKSFSVSSDVLEEFEQEVEFFRACAENSYVAEALQAGIDMQVKSC